MCIIIKCLAHTCWITTGGTNTGIMKFIGEAARSKAVSKDKILLLGNNFFFLFILINELLD